MVSNMGNQPNTSKEELLKSIKTALRGTSILLYWVFFAAYVPPAVILALGKMALSMPFSRGSGGEEAVGIFLIVFLIIDACIITYGAYSLRRGIADIGKYYNNQALIRGATVQFILWILIVILFPIAPFAIFPAGLEMERISKTLYDITRIMDFDIARRRWRRLLYYTIFATGGIRAPFALYSTRKGFKEMIKQMAQ